MQARIKWLDHMSFVAEAGSGHAVVIDGPPESGGRNLGPRPMEMVLLGLGGCTAFDVVAMLQEEKVEVDNCIIEIDAQRADKKPAVFTNIHIHYIVKGHKLSDKQVERVVNLSSEKYCSVCTMLKANVKFSYDYEVQDSSIEQKG